MCPCICTHLTTAACYIRVTPQRRRFCPSFPVSARRARVHPFLPDAFQNISCVPPSLLFLFRFVCVLNFLPCRASRLFAQEVSERGRGIQRDKLAKQSPSPKQIINDSNRKRKTIHAATDSVETRVIMERLSAVCTRAAAPRRQLAGTILPHRRAEIVLNVGATFSLRRLWSVSSCQRKLAVCATCSPTRMTATLPKTQCADNMATNISTESSVRVAESKVTSSVSTTLPLPPSFASRTGAATGGNALSVKGSGEAAMENFSQGMTDYRWCVIPGTDTVCTPSVQHRETVSNRMRLFGMPKGFPDTTAEGFQRFFYLSLTSSFVSNFASSIGYQSLLSGFFLGSSPQLWMLKDLVPALFAAYMANKVVSYESRPKFWFVVSVFMNNLTVISDMLIPSVLPNHLLAAAIITSTVKQSSALMYFVTRASALQHYAINNNLAELTKKFNSFGMVCYTVATALGILYCTYIASFTVQLITVAACCVTNMFLSSMSMMPLTFRLLNFDTMKLLLRAFILEKRRIMTPQEISSLLGVRMLPMEALKKAGIEMNVATRLIYVGPPVNKLLIRSDTLEEDVLYVNNDHMFMLAMWKPSPLPMTLRECWQRYEFPPLPRLFRKASWRRRSQEDLDLEEKFHGRRLVLLVHQKCTAEQLITAYLIMYTAVLQHGDTEEELHRFLRTCHGEQELWHLRGEEFRKMLLAADWDVHLPLLDHHNFRVSHLILPPSMRRGAKICTA
ncbi:hypothetical protein, conserved [Leishmania tarentolae]|uniref:Protein root UVB sensitive/RUS domain-containing protein n=1 Tax=Leishmania tarentolae TaxID=5689 RepID=A0A640KPV7_LEITA|nr:hypothetical protein, conserved [Leishmania tarentolae]